MLAEIWADFPVFPTLSEGSTRRGGGASRHSTVRVPQIPLLWSERGLSFPAEEGEMRAD